MNDKKILLGVCGSIAAYKSVLITRLLVKKGSKVKVILTPSAKSFITPLTLSTLSRNPVFCEYYDQKTGEWVNHVDLANWADLFLIAPLSANTLAKMTSGLCDNLLLAVYLSANCPVVVAPAMDREMYRHPATDHNISLLKERGARIIEPEKGELASGLEGTGRLSDPENIINYLQSV